MNPFRRSPRVHAPSVQQMEATECGAASLAMILAYHGKWVPLEVLRVTCGVSRDGSNALNVVKAARSYGLEAKGFRKELEALPELVVPFVVFWNFNHFLVVEGIDRRRNKVWLNDPAIGPRSVTWEEFSDGYTGIALVFSPGPEFRRGGEPPHLARSLLPRLAGSHMTIGFLVLANLALVVPGIVVPAFSKTFVDAILIAGTQTWLLPLLIGLGITALLRASLAWLQQLFTARLEMKLAMAQASRFLWHMLRLPIAFFTQRHPGDLNSRQGANDQVAQLLSGSLANGLAGLLRMLFFGGIMLAYDHTLAAAVVGLGALNMLATLLTSRVYEEGARRVAKQTGLLAAATVGGISLIETLKASGTESDYFRRFTGRLANHVNAQQVFNNATTWLSALPNLLSGITDAVVLALGGLRVISGDLTIGEVVAFQSLTRSFNEPLLALVGLFGSLRTIKGDVARLDDVLRYPPIQRLTNTDAVLGQPQDIDRRLSGRIAVSDLAFGYSPLQEPCLKGISFDIEPGQHVALVGASGSGKSTVAKLLVGLYEPWSGSIRYDGAGIAELPHQTLAASVGMVDQDIFLLEGSVRENVSLMDETLPDADVIAALRDAAILDAVMTRGGINAELLEAGRNFSGGQRQRLEIARALANRPNILILDEATSALDTVAESEIMAAIRRRGVTCVIIAHRLSTIRDCDQIVMLERGQVIERGTHADLMAAGGAYRRMVGAET
jgi:NHLM bacteriocin system ABC transporter peptidase/ATP-binding protein